MQVSETSPIRTAARPTAPAATVRRNPQWPFPVGAASRQTGSVSATEQAVIATTAHASVDQQSPPVNPA